MGTEEFWHSGVGGTWRGRQKRRALEMRQFGGLSTRVGRASRRNDKWPAQCASENNGRARLMTWRRCLDTARRARAPLTGQAGLLWARSHRRDAFMRRSRRARWRMKASVRGRRLRRIQGQESAGGRERATKQTQCATQLLTCDFNDAPRRPAAKIIGTGAGAGRQPHNWTKLRR